MRYELEKFFSNPCEASGLLIAEAPTGYGKTYETIQAIYRYIEKGGKSQILFITNLLKNLPEDELDILVREYRCSGGTDTANPAAGNRCSGTEIPHLIDCYLRVHSLKAGSNPYTSRIDR